MYRREKGASCLAACFQIWSGSILSDFHREHQQASRGHERLRVRSSPISMTCAGNLYVRLVAIEEPSLRVLFTHHVLYVLYCVVGILHTYNNFVDCRGRGQQAAAAASSNNNIVITTWHNSIRSSLLQQNTIST